MQQYYNDIHIRHDSIIAKTYYDDTPCYYLDELHKKWMPIKTVDDVIFEDEDYYVTSLDFGEWGGATWFKDKKTGKEYEAEMITPEVRKIRNEYYLISPQSIDLIKDPKKLLEVGAYTYNRYTGKDALGKFYQRERPGIKGVENLFKDGDFYTRSNFRIYASFVYNNILYLIVRNNTKTSIVKLSNNKLVKVANLDELMYMSNNSNAYRGFSSRNTYTFANKDKRLGIVEINGNTIYLHYINNTPPKK